MRKLEELNLLDDFLFGSMLSYPEIGEAFARELLERQRTEAAQKEIEDLKKELERLRAQLKAQSN